MGKVETRSCGSRAFLDITGLIISSLARELEPIPRFPAPSKIPQASGGVLESDLLGNV